MFQVSDSSLPVLSICVDTSAPGPASAGQPLEPLSPPGSMIVDIGQDNLASAQALAQWGGPHAPRGLAALDDRRLAWLEEVEFALFHPALPVEELRTLAAEPAGGVASQFFASNLQSLTVRSVAVRAGFVRARAFFGLDADMAAFLGSLSAGEATRLANVPRPLFMPRIDDARFWSLVSEARSAHQVRDMALLGLQLSSPEAIRQALAAAVAQHALFKRLVPDPGPEGIYIPLSAPLLQFLWDVLPSVPSYQVVEGLLTDRHYPTLRALIRRMIHAMGMQNVRGAPTSDVVALMKRQRLRYLSTIGLALVLMYVRAGAPLSQAKIEAWKLLRALWQSEDTDDRFPVNEQYLFSFTRLSVVVDAAAIYEVGAQPCSSCGFSTLSLPYDTPRACGVCSPEASMAMLGRAANSAPLATVGARLTRFMR